MPQPLVDAPSFALAEGWGWYLYGITRRTRPGLAALGVGPGLDGGKPVQALAYREVAAVVSPVRLAELGPEAVRAHLQDMAWLEAMVRGHERVAELVQQDHGILPARFGCVYGRADEVIAALERTYDTLAEQLDRLHGCDEWGVHAYADRAIVERRVADEAPAVRQFKEELAAARPGRAYFLQHKLADLLAAATEQALSDLAQACYDHLSRLAVASQVGPRAGTVRVQAEILRAAFLVSRPQVKVFIEEVRFFAEAHAGLRCQYSGPWPPYSFARIEEGGNR
ncbi:MAG: GvpL/GvpF family gas vesicle protein [Chloroflexi bacterium]|nr:GvpL/GvpF family gas vesicle protein [Chloroflexota bacterium]